MALEYADDNDWKAEIYIWFLSRHYRSMNQSDLAKQALLKGKELTTEEYLLQDADRQLKNL